MGMIPSKNSGRSRSRPGSYSMVVNPAVLPDTLVDKAGKQLPFALKQFMSVFKKPHLLSEIQQGVPGGRYLEQSLIHLRPWLLFPAVMVLGSIGFTDP